VSVPEDLDPAEVVSLVFAYMTAYQLLHRSALAQKGETVLVHGAAGRVGSAILELGVVAGQRLFGTASKRDLPVVERLGAVAIDYQNEDFVARIRELTGDGVDVVLDGLGGPLSLRSFRALRQGGRLVVFGRYSTIAHGRKNWPAVFVWYAATAAVALRGLLSPSRRVLAYRVQKLRIHHQDWFDEDFRALLALLRERKIHPVVAERLPLSEARRAHELLESTASTGKIVFVN
jgi:NADPH2:quinone reductase